ncbi:formate dehydrogenase accessory protein FdhE [Cupriavidus basilensis]|uniref:Protein FdhE homolog n=1 Tax=Cupriavidus basilensis TaxID=68895 RepID=A0ABT6B1C6_9BURK|nr:formate dehydrogenase accessory protein FdhE [Cupriavidus basilensis]MDF3838686.1 formate dehydrogenase accessory protein FdhE [Cupriavidus basilensis]
MVQRILQPHEIESLDHVALARLRLPLRTETFLARAQRLRQLAGGHPIGAYLELMATLAETQHDIAQSLAVPPPDQDAIRLAQAHRMPPLAAAGGQGQPAWRAALAALLNRLERQDGLPEAVAATLARLAALPPQTLEAQAQALLAGRAAEADCAIAPFLMAALQVSWTSQASQLAERDVPDLDVPGVCPVCGTLPVASIVRIGGRYQGLRYLHCALCASEWHMVRVKCTHCESTEGIGYHIVEGVEGAGANQQDASNCAVKAESCDHCHTYRKICYMEKDPLVEPVADDLASLALDLLMGEAGYARSSGNPMLWQGMEDAEHTENTED